MGSMSMVNGGRKEGVGRQGAWHAVGTLKWNCKLNIKVAGEWIVKWVH